jgi:hypothetical protein
LLPLRKLVHGNKQEVYAASATYNSALYVSRLLTVFAPFSVLPNSVIHVLLIGVCLQTSLITSEANTTFYAIPAVETVAHWRAETPVTFRFCFKIPRSISHKPNLGNHRQETYFFIERMRGLGERLGTIFLQLPPAFSPVQMTQLRSFLEFWPTDVRLAVEVRHLDFFEAEHAEALNKLLRGLTEIT